MQQVEKKYLNGYINADDEANLVKPNEVLRAVNMRFGSTDDGATGRWESILSNEEVVNADLPVTGTNICIGSKSDDAGRYIVYFNYNSGGDHGIYLYYKPTGTFYEVLLEANLTDGLNFSKDKLITCVILNNIAYWTDNYNEPRSVHLGAAIELNGGTSPLETDFEYSGTLEESDIALIKKPYGLAPTIAKNNDAAHTVNLIGTESFQFAVEYIYYTGDRSVLSPFSTASKVNSESDAYNYIFVTIPAAEDIPQGVMAVRLVCKYAGSGETLVVKTWDKRVSDQASEITAHNAGTPLSFEFYNNVNGEAIDDTSATLPFHDVPLTVLAMEAAKNRLFLGNFTSGYNTPSTTSLEITAETGTAGANISTTLYRVDSFQDDPDDVMDTYIAGYYVYLDTISPIGWYFLNTTQKISSAGPPSLDPAPASVAIADLTFQGTDLAAVGAYLTTTRPFPVTITGNSIITADTFSVTGVSSSTATMFKARGIYQFGIVFYDKYLRKCGVVTNDGLILTIADRDFDGTNVTTGVSWTLDNANALTEIPEWAYYYQIVRTLNQRTRYFIQSVSTATKYVTKDSAGDITYIETFGVDSTSVALDITPLNQFKMGYDFAEGDQCILIDESDNIYDLEVEGTDGKYILVKSQDLGTLTGDKHIFEIYTPYRKSSDEPFYEVGAVYLISNPGTSSRAYSTLSGTLQGDSFLLTRTYNGVDYSCEGMNPNDKTYKRWDTDAGRINLITLLGEEYQPIGLKYSDTFIPGTLTNGLCSFLALNQENLSLEMGAIMSLKTTSKVQGEGNVMLAIGKTQTASIYIGEAQISDADGNNFFVKSQGVIGQINPLKGDYGTLNPESVVAFKGNVYWLDILSGRFLQYSINGIDDISEGENQIFKFSRVSKNISEKYLSLSSAQIEALGSRPFIFGGIDPHHREVFWTIPKLGDVPKNDLDYSTDTPAYVDDYSYPYDILNYRAKTLVYKIGKRWMGEYSMTPETWGTLDSSTYSFKNGKVYLHNVSGTYNEFYGTQHKSRLAIVFNQDNSIKEFKTIAIEGTLPEWVHFRSEEPYEQSSDLVGTDFENKEGVYYAALFKDRLSPSISGTVYDKQFKGDDMRTKALLCLVQWNETAITYLRTITVGYNNSSGHY